MVRGFHFKTGQLVSFPVYAIHHDPDLYEDPETFQPDRFARDGPRPPQGAYLPFGAGPRNCIGMRFALEMAKIGLVAVLQSFVVVKAAETLVSLLVFDKVSLPLDGPPTECKFKQHFIGES